MVRCLPALTLSLLVVAFLPLATVLAQEPDSPTGGFTAELDPRVFQPGGFGPWSEALGPIFDQAAVAYSVPRELLLALGRIGSAFENRGDQPTIEYGYGVMALRRNELGGDSLDLAASLLAESADEVKTNPRLNIMGAAAVLDQYAAQTQIDRTAGIDAWLEPIIRYAGLDEEDSSLFADEVFDLLRSGLDITNTWNERFTFDAQSVESLTQGTASSIPPIEPASADYGPAIWDPAASCNYTATYCAKDTVVIHTIEGSAAGCRSWFKNCNAEVSAHYVISEAGTIWQMVDEDYKAWHVSCYNSRAIGLEHEGYAASPSHPQSLYDASALLVRDICDSWGIPKEKRTVGPGILGHIDVTNCCCGTHTDPGNGWDWGYFIGQVQGAPPPPAWAATYLGQSYPSSMTAGSTAIVWAEFRNDGTGHWRHAETRLGTSSPQDHTSPFCTPSNWVGCNRPTDVDQSDVAQGQTGCFTFILTAPSTPGTFVEKYRPVRESITWFGPEITWTITVTASKGNLNGTVRNASTSAAIAGAGVTLNGVGQTTTNSSGQYSFNDVTAGSYTIAVSATGYNPASDSVAINAGSTTTKDFALTPTDTEAPTTPMGLAASATGPTTVQLTWDPSSDNVGVASYDVRRNGSIIGSSTAASYADNSANPNTTYTYEVRARDSVPNYSGWSDSAMVNTPPVITLVFTDGFSDVNLGGWTQQAQSFTHSTGASHNTYTGSGAAYATAGLSSQMYHPFARPFAQGRVWGWFYDGKNGWKPSVCGWAYRQALSLRDPDGAAKMYIDNEFYSASDNSKYFFRTVGGGGIGHTSYATRNPNTSCAADWIYFETAVSPGAPGASPTGSFTAKVTDGAGTTTTTQNLTADFFSYGIGRITLGQNAAASANECYWDDIGFEAMPPGAPVLSAPTTVSNSQIRWNFTPADNNHFGYDVADTAGGIVSPLYPAAGWLNRAATSWTEGGLAANSQYSRRVRAWNGTLNSAYSFTATAWTLCAVPTAMNVTPDRDEVCIGESVTWTAVGGFGPGTLQYYKYAWDQNETYTFTGSESVWSTGTITMQATAAGPWYLHVQGFNGADVANGTFDYSIMGSATTTITTPPSNVDACPGTTVTFSVGADGRDLIYRWQKNGADLMDGGHYSGSTTATLTISGVDAGDLADYRCAITGSCGNADSSTARLTLKNATIIGQQPQSQSVCAGVAVAFTVLATGEGAVTYQWQKDGVDITGATFLSYDIPQAGSLDTGEYQCAVTSGCGTVYSDPATLTVIVQPADFDADCDVDQSDFALFQACMTGANPDTLPPSCTGHDLDLDGDVDQSDFGVFQRCLSGEDQAGDPACAD